MAYNKTTLAQLSAWLGAAITTLSLNHLFGKYSQLAGTLGALITGLAAHTAAQTSAGHPNG